VLLLAVAAQPAQAVVVDTLMDAAIGGGVICAAIDAHGETCHVPTLPGSTFTVTWKLPASTSLNGYDFNLSWDPSELTLLSAQQLIPNASPPNTIPFVIAPNPADPVGSAAVALSVIAYPTTNLFRATFQAASTMHANCIPDVTWTPNGNGLAPGTVELGNPAGASVDLGADTLCSDGLDNDGDGKVDFDGGACAGLVPVAQPDPECAGTAAFTAEAPASGCGLLGPEALLLWLARRRRLIPG
jgi:hypothetical protein